MAGNMLKTSQFCRLHAICMCCQCYSRLLVPDIWLVSSLESLHDQVISLRSGRDEAWGRIEKMWSASPSFLLLPVQELVGRCQPWWASECLARKLTSHPFSNWLLPVYLFLSVARTLKAFGRISLFPITVGSHVKGQSTLAVEIWLARLADLHLK